MHPFAGIEDIAREVMARHAAQRQAPAAKPVPAKTAAQLRAELAQAAQGFDPAYAMSDDHTVYCRGQEQADRIADLTRRIAVADFKERAAA